MKIGGETIREKMRDMKGGVENMRRNEKGGCLVEGEREWDFDGPRYFFPNLTKIQSP